MKVLFVSSGNTTAGISPIIKNQGESLVNEGFVLDYFTIRGKGLIGYLKAIPKLKKELSDKEYDIVHAHYSLSAFVASLAGARPLIVSLMGSDVKAKSNSRFVIRLFHRFYWKKTILKSQDMNEKAKLNNVEILPNGVDIGKFRPISKRESENMVGWDNNIKHVLFVANPGKKVKNFDLAKKAFESIHKNYTIGLHYLDNIPNDEMPYYYNASDVVLLTSDWEGSPNVIKEAMASNIPIVSTDVGDVREVIGKTQGCFITTNNPNDIARKLEKALDYGLRTEGRKNIRHLNSKLIANRLINIYNKVLNNNKI